ncbi:MAG: PLP-dependent aminotransferase family protein [Bacteroidetes bacterium]|nr:PLP-dependent aminotransferase family protein [Bacteroidota bacterium]
MQALSTLISIDKTSREPVYLQIAAQLIALIRGGTLGPGHRLPSTRQLAGWLDIHRKTAVQAYDELLLQGWLESRSGSGTFVAGQMPVAKPQRLQRESIAEAPAKPAKGFSIRPKPHLERDYMKPQSLYHLDDGLPDMRLAPLEEMARAYRSQLLTGSPYLRLGYSDIVGPMRLRQALCGYLGQTRGLNCEPENILITRGSIMGMHLAANGFLEPGDTVVVGEWNYGGADMNFLHAGANLLTIPVDENGIIVDALEEICRRQPVRMIYVTSHHHYPTTVALCPERRLQLLALAEAYGFIIFEDDYDFDFHYAGKPLLPLASADRSDRVLYCGSFTKAFCPSFRAGYLVGPPEAIQHLGKIRRIIDRQGDTMLENAIADLLQAGIIQRYLRKSLKAYRQRRDLFCGLLQSELGDYLQFRVPDGGMAVWTHFDTSIDLRKLSQKALQEDLYFSDGYFHRQGSPLPNATRLGFASSTTEELEKCVEILVRVIKG